MVYSFWQQKSWISTIYNKYQDVKRTRANVQLQHTGSHKSK